jgi:hypothetical protein
VFRKRIAVDQLCGHAGPSKEETRRGAFRWEVSDAP